MKAFNRSNCESTQRDSQKCVLGGTVSLFGIHSYEWSVVRVHNGETTIMKFNGRIEARKEFKKLALV